VIIIPARLASTRFPRKILVDIDGLPMVIRSAKLALSVDDTIIACDDAETLKVCENFGVKAVMTSQNHASGTDRISEACKILGLSDFETVINLQADEPFLEKKVLADFVKFTKNQNSDFVMTSAYKSVSEKDAECPNLVKVVLNSTNHAIYFSRAKIPFDRDGGFKNYLGHLGLYGFNVKSLSKFCELNASELENIEKLEQLRAISNSLPIAMLKVETSSFGIDTPSDLSKALLR
jgi:3-deoxy-manno-octulosonate cytidylyltransferase (CMP-KDO synthetase)